MRLNNLADILMYLRVLKGYRAIRISQLLCLLLTVWLTGAGFVAVVSYFFPVVRQRLDCANELE